MQCNAGPPHLIAANNTHRDVVLLLNGEIAKIQAAKAKVKANDAKAKQALQPPKLEGESDADGGK